MNAKVQQYFFYFLLYSILGWCYEVFLEVVVYRWGFTNRGFLFGPYCPVYGFGALVFLLCLNRYKKEKIVLGKINLTPVLLFFACMAAATAIELATSYIMELFTGGWPWQTYTDYKYNFQGRIALSPSLRFGLGGILILYVLQPPIEKLLHKLQCRTRNIIFLSSALVLGIDFAVQIAKFI